MSKILIGTSGFFYDDWKGEFYPRATATKDYLGYYALQFKVLELNFSYYRIPEVHQSRQMIDKSGGKLEFVVKAHRQMTHEVSDESIKKTVPLFIEGVSPFLENGLLGALLLQFPQSFHYIADNRIYLKSLIEALSPFPIFVEFRNREWLKKSVYDTLRKLGAGIINGFF